LSEPLRDPIDPDELSAAINRAWQRRAPLHRDADTDAYRIFHGWTEGGPGIEIDRYGDAALIDYRDRVGHLVDGVAATLATLPGIRLVVGRPRSGEPAALVGDMPAEPVPVCEGGLRFLIEPWRPGNPGLFVDARAARAWLRDHARDRAVLNLFAFTGSLGVAAAIGGARRVVHVDSQRSALARCLANHALNGVPIDDRDLARVNIYQHLKRVAARRKRWGGIVLDPPPPPRRDDAGKALEKLAALTAPTLDPDGWLLCFFHHSDRSRDDHEQAVLAAAGVPLEVAWRGTSGDDFPETDPNRKLRLTAFRRPGSC
jgi:23S rRNA (cytosine1962-C5)-methyltransferase